MVVEESKAIVVSNDIEEDEDEEDRMRKSDN